MPGGLGSMGAIRALLSGRGAQVAGLAAAMFVLISLVTRLPAWPLVDARVFDYASTIAAPSLPPDGPIIVAIDEPSLAEIKAQWPWPRSLHARLIEALRAAGAKVIGMDVIFAEASRAEEDAALAAALGPDVVLAGDETLVTSAQADQFIRVLPLPIFTDALALSGIASVALDHDGVLRRMPLYDDGFAAMLATAAGVAADMPAANALIQTYGPARTYPTVSYYQALDPDQFLPEGLFKDRVVIVGLSLQNAASVAKGGADVFATAQTVHTGKLVAGAEMQATVFDNFRLGSSIAQAGPWLRQILLVLAVVCAALSVYRQTGWHTAVIGVLVVLVLVTGAFLALRFGRVFVSPVAAALAFAAVAAGQVGFDYARESRNRRQITRAFAQYLSPALVEQLARDPSKLKLGGERRELSILFCDVRGFTTISEQLKDDPQQLTALINRLLTPLSEIVLSHGGTIDKYIGDCIMAFWNAPLDDPHHARNAVAAALAMLASMDGLNASLQQEAEAAGRRHYPLRIGIGINSGECVVGNMGSSSRFDYSALGDSVNLAARLEGASKDYGVSLLIGENTAMGVRDLYPLIELGRIVVKGKTEEVPVFTVDMTRSEPG